MLKIPFLYFICKPNTEVGLHFLLYHNNNVQAICLQIIIIDTNVKLKKLNKHISYTKYINKFFKICLCIQI